ncbi:MAG: hypothetical protein AAF526_05640 [Pseudomonadota bacterium]
MSIVAREIRHSGSFTEKLTDYSHAYACGLDLRQELAQGDEDQPLVETERGKTGRAFDRGSRPRGGQRYQPR